MTIVEFLLARIAEDEDIAQAAQHWDPSPHWGSNVTDGRVLIEAEHAGRWAPARVLAECQAKRELVYLSEHGCGDDYERVQRALAAVYADHPDYNPAWQV